MVKVTVHRLVLAFVGFLMVSCAVRESSEQSVLITEEEYAAVQAEQAHEEMDRGVRASPGAPTIIVERPDLGAKVVIPVDVRVRFIPEEGATINPDSLEVRYGMFDLTERLREMVKVTPEGIEGRVEKIPPGTYGLKVSVADDRGRRGRTVLKFTAIARR